MPLPTARSAPKTDIEALYWLIFGPPGIGKSTLAAGFPNAIFFTTERAHRHLSIYDRQIKDWQDFRLAVQELKTKDGSKFKNVVIDTVDLLFKMCTEEICKKLGIDHPQDESYGKGYDAVKTEFQRELIKLSLFQKGIVFVSHAQDKEITARNIKYTKTVPSMPGGCHKVIVPFVDVCCYCGFGKADAGKRVAIFKPEEHLEAKDRFGRFPAEVDLSYGAIEQAWREGRGLRAAPTKVSSPIKKIARIKSGGM